MPRALWKGAISFGLVHIPVALYPAATRGGLDFDWLDKRSMAPVGYKRVNKLTGREVGRENIVRGLQYEKGKYVVLSDEEIRAAHVKATQTVDIVAFVDAGELQPAYFEMPYFLAPAMRGEKVYALLRETMKRENKVGIAHVVIQTKQHLAALIPGERAILLNTLRWPGELRDAGALKLPAAGLKGAGVGTRELKMASQLVQDMSTKWDPSTYKDSFRADIMKLAKRKASKGKIALPPEVEEERPSAKVIDFTELLRQSLQQGKRKRPRTAAEAEQRKSPARRRRS